MITSSKNGSQEDWFRKKKKIALTQTKLTMNPSSETIELRGQQETIKLEVLKRFWPTEFLRHGLSASNHGNCLLPFIHKNFYVRAFYV